MNDFIKTELIVIFTVSVIIPLINILLTIIPSSIQDVKHVIVHSIILIWMLIIQIMDIFIPTIQCLYSRFGKSNVAILEQKMKELSKTVLLKTPRKREEELSEISFASNLKRKMSRSFTFQRSKGDEFLRTVINREEFSFENVLKNPSMKSAFRSLLLRLFCVGKFLKNFHF